jgi:hypothetical protein
MSKLSRNRLDETTTCHSHSKLEQVKDGRVTNRSPSISRHTLKHRTLTALTTPLPNVYNLPSPARHRSRSSLEMRCNTRHGLPTKPSALQHPQTPNIEYRQLVSRAVTQRLHSPAPSHDLDEFEVEERIVAKAKAHQRLRRLGVTWGNSAVTLHCINPLLINWQIAL